MAIPKKKLDEAMKLVGEAKTILEEIRDQAQEDYDNKSDNWRDSEAGEAMSGKIETLGDAIGNLEEADSNISTAGE